MELLGDGAAFGAEQGKGALLTPRAGPSAGPQRGRSTSLALGPQLLGQLCEESQAWHLCGQTAACWHQHRA